jgi:hypothetical protein
MAFKRIYRIKSEAIKENPKNTMPKYRPHRVYDYEIGQDITIRSITIKKSDNGKDFCVDIEYVDKVTEGNL